MKSSILFLASILVFSLSLLAQTSDPTELGKWWKESEIVNQLRLTESQIDKIEQRFLDYRPTLADLNSELKNRGQELSALMETDPIDDAKVRDLTLKVALLRAELEKANSFMMIAFRKELTKQQWDKLQKIRESRRASTPIAAPGTPATTSTQSGEQIYVVGGPIKAPIGRYLPMPQYTRQARAARIEGVILLQGIVRKDGRVTDLIILKGLGYGLDQSAIETIGKEWQFEPSKLNGQPVNVQADLEVSFRLF